MAPIAADFAPLFARTTPTRALRPARLLQSTALVMVLAASPVMAQTWDGSGGGGGGGGGANPTSWNNNHNWGGNDEPTSSTDAIIGANANNPEVLANDPNAKANSVTLLTGGDLTVNGSLDVDEAVTLQDGGGIGSQLTIGGTGVLEAGGLVSVSQDSTLSNDGTLRGNGGLAGSVSNSGSVTNTGTITANVTNTANGTLTSSGTIDGDVSNSGAATITGSLTGELTTLGGSSTVIDGDLGTALDGVAGVSNAGSLTLGAGATLVLDAGEALHTANGGQTTLQGAVTGQMSGAFGGQITLDGGAVSGNATVAGALTSTGNSSIGAGGGDLRVTRSGENVGTLTVASGTLTVAGNGAGSDGYVSGTLDVNLGATLDGNITYSSAGTGNLDGTVTGDLTNNGAISLNGSVTGDLITDEDGTTTVDGDLTVTGAVENDGTLTVEATRTLTLGGGTPLTTGSGGITNILGTVDGDVADDFGADTTLTAGTVTGGMSVDGGVTISGASSIGGDLEIGRSGSNFGAVEVTSGTVQVTGDGSGADVDVSGRLDIRSTATVVADVGIAAAGRMSIATTGTLDGTLDMADDAVADLNGSVTGGVTNDGSLRVAGSVSGALLTTSNGATIVDNALSVTGQVTNRGALTVSDAVTLTLGGGTALQSGNGGTTTILGTVTGDVTDEAGGSTTGRIVLTGGEVTGDVTVNDRFESTGVSTIGDDLRVRGTGTATIGGTLTVSGDGVGSNTQVAGDLTVSSGGRLNSSTEVQAGGAVVVSGNATLAGNTDVAGTGSLTVQTSGTLTGAVDLAANATGDLNGTVTGAVTNAGDLDVRGSVTGALTTATGATTTVDGTLSAGGAVTNAGTMLVQDAGVLTLSGGNVLRTQDGATTTIEGRVTGAVADQVDGGGFGRTVLSGGQVTGTASLDGRFESSGTSSIGGDLDLQDDAVAVIGGQLTVTGDTTNRNSLSVNGTLSSGLENAVGATASVTGTGAVQGDVTNRGTLALAGGAEVRGNLTTVAAGVVTVTGTTANPTEVSGTLTNGGTLNGNASGAGDLRLEAGSFVNNGTVSNAGPGSGAFIIAADTITLNAGSTVSGDVSLRGDIFSHVSLTFDEDERLFGDLTNHSDGTLTISADLDADGNTVTNAGVIAVTATGSLDGNLTNLASGTGTVAGDVSGALSNAGTLTVTADVGGAVTNTDQLTMTGTIGGALTNSGTADVTGPVGGTVGNTGSLVLAGAVSGDLDNDGTADVTGNVAGSVSNSDQLVLAGNVGGGLSNSGTASVTGAVTGTVTNSGSLVQNGNIGALDNDGTADVTGNVAGDVSSTDSLVLAGNVGGALTNSGTAEVTGTVTGTVTNRGDLVQNGTIGALVNEGDAEVTGNVRGAVSSTDRLVLEGDVGGSLTASGRAMVTGDVAGALSNAGTMTLTGNAGGTLGNTGTLTMTGTVQGAVSNGGSLTLTGDAGANVTSSGSLTMAGDVAGRLRNSGTLSYAGAVTGALVNTANGTATLTGNTSAGRISNAGAMEAAAGVRVVAAEGLENSGTLTLGGPLRGDLTNTGSGRATLNGHVTGRVTNAGTLISTGDISGRLTNTGTVRLGGDVSGAVQNQSGGAVTLTADVAAGSVINHGRLVVGDVFTLSTDEPLRNERSGTLILGGETTSGVTNAGRMTLNGGTVGGALVSTGTLIAAGDSAVSGVFRVNGGTASLLEGGSLNTGRGIVVARGASFTSAGDLRGSVRNAGSFTQDGDIRGDVMNRASGTLDVDGLIRGDVQNSGQATLAGEVRGNVTQMAGSLSLGGDLAVTGSFTTATHLEIGEAVTLEAGRYRLAEGTMTRVAGSLSAAGGIVNDGRLTLASTGSVTGDVDNGGILTLNGASTLTGDITGGVINAGAGATINGAIINADDVNIGGVPVTGSAAPGDVTLEDLRVTRLIGDDTNLVFDLELDDADPAAVLSDRIIVDDGNAATADVRGSFNLSFNFDEDVEVVQPGAPIQLIDGQLAAGTVFTADFSDMPGNGLFDFTLEQDNATGVYLETAIDRDIVALGGSVALSQSVIGALVNRPTSPFTVGRAIEEEKNCAPGGWARVTTGRVNASGTSTSAGASPESNVSASYSGLQFGGDLSCFNGAIGGWDMAFGVIGGMNRGSGALSTTPSGKITSAVVSPTSTKFDQTYLGLYTTASKGNLVADLQVRSEDTTFTLNNASIGNTSLTDAKMDTKATTLSGSISASFPIKETGWNVVPTAGFMLSRSKTNTLTFDADGLGNRSTLNIDDHTMKLGFAGLSASTVKIAPSGNAATSYFVTGTYYKDFSEELGSTFTSPTFDITERLSSQTLGSYGEISLGVSYLKILDTTSSGAAAKQFNASVRVDGRFSGSMDSAAITGQVRWQF